MIRFYGACIIVHTHTHTHAGIPSVQVVRVGSHEVVEFLHLTVHSFVTVVEQCIQIAIFQLQRKGQEKTLI